MKKRKLSKILSLNKNIVSKLNGGRQGFQGPTGPLESRVNDDASQCLCGPTGGSCYCSDLTCGAAETCPYADPDPGCVGTDQPSNACGDL